MVSGAALLVLLAVQLPPSEDFERGKNAFARGEYPRAIELLRPLLYPENRLATEGEVAQAHRMLGVAHLFESQGTDARREFTELLRLRPDYRFDPLLDPPQVVDFFNRVVKEQDEEIALLEARKRKVEAALEAQRKAEEERARNAARVVIEQRFERRSYLLNFVPFGAGQFQNGQRSKAWGFLAAESVLAAASVGAFSTNLALFGFRPKRRCLMEQKIDAGGLPAPCPRDQIDRSDEELSSVLMAVQLTSGGLFFAVAAWGVIDAILNFRSEVPLGPPVEKRGPATMTFRLQPALVGSSPGAGLTGRF